MPTITERQSRGKTVFLVQVRVQGHTPVSRTLPTRRLAQKWGEETETKLRYGDLATTSIASGKSPSLLELHTRYTGLHTVSPWEQNVVKVFSAMPFFSKPITQITDDDVIGVRELFLVSKGVKATTLAKYLRIIRKPIKTARTKWGYRGLIDPFDLLDLKATEKPRERTMTTEEYRLISRYLLSPKRSPGEGRMPAPLFMSLVDFALETAMRLGEIVKMRIEHISEQYQYLYIPETKTNTPRTIPLSEKAERILRDVVAGRKEGIIWGEFIPKAVSKRWAYTCKVVGIKNLTFHDLRHTSLSNYDRAGFSKGELKLLGGHKTDKMLFRYLHADLEPTRQKMRRQLENA